MAKRTYRQPSKRPTDTTSQPPDLPDTPNESGQEDDVSSATGPEYPTKEALRRPKIVIRAEDASRAYGESNPEFEHSLLPDGFALPPEIEIELSCSADPDSPVIPGGYPIVPKLSGPQDALDGFEKQHNITYKNGRLQVKRAPITITVADNSRVYGSSNPEFAVTVSANHDNLTATASCSATANSPIGAYDITAQLNDPLGKHSNYTVSSTKAKLTITPATLTVIVRDVDRPYGSSNPPFQVAISDNIDGIKAVGTCDAKPDSRIGPYPVVAQLIDPLNQRHNYAIALMSGTLQVTPLTPTYYETAANLQTDLFQEVGKEVALAQQSFTTKKFPVIYAELEIISNIVSNAPNLGPDDVLENIRAIAVAFMKANASLSCAADSDQSGLREVGGAICQLHLAYAAQPGGAAYRKLNGALMCAQQILSGILTELADPNQAFPTASMQILNTAEALQTSLGKITAAIPAMDALGCSTSEQETIASLQKLQNAAQQACCALLCEFDVWHGLLQPGNVLNLRPAMNLVVYQISHIGFAIGELKAESRDWREEIAATAIAMKREIRKLTQTVESSQSKACGGSTKHIQERIIKLDGLADEAIEWTAEHFRVDRVPHWSDQAMAVLDQLLRCDTELPAGLSEGLFRISSLVFQVGCHARKASAGAAQAKPLPRDQVEEFVLRFPDHFTGGNRAVRVITTKGHEVGRFEPDAQGNVRIPAKPGDEFDFIGLFDGIPFETVRMKA